MFRFFFMFSIGILLFFFVGRFLLFAFLLAAGLSFVFFLFRKAMGLFQGYDWEERQYRGERQRNLKAVWKNDLLVHYPVPLDDYVKKERIIEVQ